jgi:hypothetical protein
VEHCVHILRRACKCMYNCGMLKERQGLRDARYPSRGVRDSGNLRLEPQGFTPILGTYILPVKPCQAGFALAHP